ncbi:MAG TPA: DUF2341 domain-containing protein, partial [Patescibacteria group bacterium]|nr:DUF2341 domain-containing protein [Patescibacteria group bacterium]
MRKLYRFFHKVLKRADVFAIVCIKKIKALSKNRFALFSSGAIVMLVIMVLVASVWDRGGAASYTWAQTSWVGGADVAAYPNHTSNQSNWTKYDSKDAGVTINGSNQITLANSGATVTHTTDANFNAGTASTVTVAANSVTLSPAGYSLTGGTWSYRKKITFDNSAQAENLTNFPVMVKLTSSNFDFTKAKTNGEDIRFTDSNGTTELSYEIEQWSAAGQIAVIWIKVPQIDLSSATDTIYVYYGNASVTDGQAATSVWSNGYAAVWHLNNDPAGSAPQFLDSTSNAKHGTNGGGLVTGDMVDGYIGKGLQFSGASDDYFTISNVGDLFTSGIATFEVWTKTSTASGNGFIEGFEASQTAHYPWSGDDLYINTFRNSRVNFSSNVDRSQWHYITITTQTGGNWLFYQNTVQKASAAAVASIMIDATSEIGKSVNTLYTGFIDELRLSTVVRSTAWMAAQYKSTNNTFNTFGSENEVPSPLVNSGTLTSATIDTGSANNSFGNISWTATSTSGTKIVKFQIAARTADSGWVSGDYLGPDGTTSTYYTTAAGEQIRTGTNGKRYIRYKAYLLKDAGDATGPSLDDLSIVYNVYSASATLSSSAFNTESSAALLSGLTWTESLPTGTDAKFQVRTAPNNAGVPGTWSSWCGPDNGTTGCDSATYFTAPAGGETVDADLRDASNDQWIQYKLFLISDGTGASLVSAVNVAYVVNTAPVISSVTASQGSDGIVTVGYTSADSESESQTISLYYQPAGVTLNESLSSSDTTAITVSSATNLPDAATILFDNEIITYTSKTGNDLTGTITRGVSSSSAVSHTSSTALYVKAITVSGNVGASQAVGASKSIAWVAKTDLNGLYGTLVAKVHSYDGNLGNQFGSANASSFALDTKNPTGVSLVVNANKATANRADLTIAASDDNSMTMNISNDSGGAADTVNATSGTYVAYAT